MNYAWVPYIGVHPSNLRDIPPWMATNGALIISDVHYGSSDYFAYLCRDNEDIQIKVCLYYNGSELRYVMASNLRTSWTWSFYGTSFQNAGYGDVDQYDQTREFWYKDTRLTSNSTDPTIPVYANFQACMDAMDDGQWTEGRDINDCSVLIDPDRFIADGQPKIPTVRIDYLDLSTVPPTVITLLEGRDYTLEFEDNVYGPTASIIIAGIGDYSGVRTEHFTILAPSQDINNCRILVDPNEIVLDGNVAMYTGGPIRPPVEVYALEQLEEGVDFRLVYLNNIKAGRATINIIGIGEWGGTAERSFIIIGGPSNPDPGESEPEVPGGDDDFDTDPIDPPDIPTISALGAGFVSLWVPTAAQLGNLAAYMWAGAFDIENFRKIVANPADAIIGLSILPVTPASSPEVFSIGNVSTGLAMNKASEQFVVVDCGTLQFPLKYGAYLDFDPYTKIELFLPYIGIKSISADDVMGKTVGVRYIVDALSGACAATVSVNGGVLYNYIGECATPIPVTSGQYMNAFQGLAQIAASIGSVAMTGGAGLGPGISNIASSVVNMVKPDIQRSGSIGGSGGLLANQTPYIIMSSPNLINPRDRGTYIGNPAFITYRLGDIIGYTEVEEVHLENIPATEAELIEIKNLLEEGVLL